jgi:hypothetical protein
MSIGIIIKGTEGLVLAAESRITLTLKNEKGEVLPVNYDNARKVLQFAKQPYIGAVTYGLGGIGLRNANSYINEFEATLPDKRMATFEFSKLLSAFFINQWNKSMDANYKGPPMVFNVGGYDENQPYGVVYQFEIPHKPDPIEQHKGAFGISWGGQREIVDRLVAGYDSRLLNIVKNKLNLNKDQVKELQKELLALQIKAPIQIMPLQDCIDLAILFIATTIETQRLTVGIRGCGGPIDIATVTKLTGFKFIQQKNLLGQR